jgi:hypothetical protein
VPVVQEIRLNNHSKVIVTWDNAALAALEREQRRPIVRDLIRRGNRVQQAARRQIRFGHVGVGGRAARHGRLNLRDTIHVRLVHGGAYTGFLGGDESGLPVVTVGSEDPIALLHHEGTRPHVIVPRNAAYLVFWSDRAGRVIYTKRVMHPGTKPNRYLTDNLHLAVE